VTPAGSAVAFEGVSSITRRVPTGGAGGLQPAAWRRARRWPWWGPAARARARCSSCCCAFTTRSRAIILLDGCRRRAMALEDLRQRIGIVPQDAVIFSASALENIRYGKPGRQRRGGPRRRQAAFADEFIRRLPEGYDTFLGERGVRLRAGSASASPLPAPCSRTRRCCCWTKPPARWTPRASAWCRPRWKPRCATAPRWSSPTGWPRCRRPTALWCWTMAASWSKAPTPTLVAQGGVYARLAALQFMD
jgi:ATP-binding cassette subfamily B protein